MSDPVNPFEAMMAQAQKQAQEMAKAFDPDAADFSPKGFENLWPTMPKEMMEMMFGRTLNKDGLDAKTRLLLTLAGLTCQGAQADAALSQTVKHALAAGAHKQEIVEAIGQMSVFAGLPAVTRALELAQGVAGETEEDKS